MECIIKDGEGAYISTVFAKETGIDGNRIVAYDRYKTCIKLIDCVEENDEVSARVVIFKWSEPLEKFDNWQIFDEAFSDGELLDWLDNEGKLPVDDLSPYSGRVEEYTPDSWSKFTSEDEFLDLFDFDIYEPRATIERQDGDIYVSLDCYGYIVDLHFCGVKEEKNIDIIDRIYFSMLNFEGSDAVRWSIEEASHKPVNGVRHILNADEFNPTILCREVLWRVRFVNRTDADEEAEWGDEAGKLYNMLKDDFKDISRNGDSVVLNRNAAVYEMRWQSDGFVAVVNGKAVNRGINSHDAYFYALDFFGKISVKEIEGEIICRTPANNIGALILSKGSVLILAAMGIIAGIVLLAVQTYIWQAICILVVAGVVAVADIAIILRAAKAKRSEYILTKDALYLAEGGYLKSAIWISEIWGAEFHRSPISATSGRIFLSIRDCYRLKVPTLSMKNAEKFCRLINELAAKSIKS